MADARPEDMTRRALELEVAVLRVDVAWLNRCIAELDADREAWRDRLSERTAELRRIQRRDEVSDG